MAILEKNFRHVGYIVTDLAQSVAQFQHLFDIPDDAVQVFPPYQVEADSRFAFLKVGGIEIECIQPISEHFKAILFDSGVGLNHICFTVQDIEAEVALMAEKGVRPGHVTPDGIIEMPSQKMVYFNPMDTGGILIEYIEPK